MIFGNMIVMSQSSTYRPFGFHVNLDLGISILPNFHAGLSNLLTSFPVNVYDISQRFTLNHNQNGFDVP